MAVAVKTILDQARHTLVDTDKTFWIEEELAGWYNAAILAVIAARPDAHAKQLVLNCVLGTLQQLPADALRLIRVLRNEGADKRSITEMDMALMDSSRPDWHSQAAPVGVAQHYIYDQRDPKNFYLYPAVAAATKVLISYSYVPPQITPAQVPTAQMPIDDVYYNPVLDYILFRGFSKVGKFVQGGDGRARMHLISFNEALGIKMQADQAMR